MDVVLGIVGFALFVCFAVAWFTERNNDEDGATPGGRVRQWALGLAVGTFTINIVMRHVEPADSWRWIPVVTTVVWTGAVVVWASLEWRRRRTRTVVRTHRRRFGDRYVPGPPPGDG